MKTQLMTATGLALCALLASAPEAAAQRGFYRGSYDRGHGGSFGGRGQHRSYRNQHVHRAPVRIGIHIGHQHGPACHPIVVPGYYEQQRVKIWVPAHAERIHVPALYETRYDRWGHPYQVCVRAASYREVWHPGAWTWRTDRVWIDGYTRYGCGY